MKNLLQKKKVRENLLSDMLTYLQSRDTTQVNGMLCYKERLRAWNIIHLRKEILNLFPELRQRREKFGYTMYYNRSFKEVRKIVDGLEKNGSVPILLLLGKVKESN